MCLDISEEAGDEPQRPGLSTTKETCSRAGGQRLRVLARALKASPVSEQIQEMRVSNWADRETDKTARLRCEDFQMYTFSGEADPGAVRASWKDWTQS